MRSVLDALPKFTVAIFVDRTFPQPATAVRLWQRSGDYKGGNCVHYAATREPCA
jgi:hypothetical protein